jgi:hypothetical protein
MIDWDSLQDAYGRASEVPVLLGRLSTDANDDVWAELWSRICHQGTVYDASFAALAPLVTWARAQVPAQRPMVLALAGAIIGSRDSTAPAELRTAAAEATVSGFEQAGLETLGTPGLSAEDFIYVAEAILAFRGEPIWGTQLNRLDSGEFEGQCPGCGADLYLVVGQDGFFAAKEEWVNRPQTRRVPIEAATRESLSGVPRWLHDRAVLSKQARIADCLLHLFGATECPACSRRIAVAEAVERACAETR